ncbi:MAG: BamA/TamA family outer membrane protein [Rhodobacteraceae bacterium]|nr:BamA/TamA family outer membrane protein [Paracoccaceae bacterium]
MDVRNEILFPFAAAMSALSFAAEAQETTATYTLLGVSHYEPSELLSFATLLTQQQTGFISPQGLAQSIETIYLEDGYVLAEVFLAADGLTLVVDEGEVGDIFIEGVDEDHFRLIEAYTRPLLAKRGLQQKDLERAIMLVEDIGSITATAEFDYPPGAAHARLRIIADELDRDFGSLSLDHPSREFGEAVRLSFSQSYLSALTAGDLLRFNLSATTELDRDDTSVWGAVAYRMPLGGSGLYGEAYLGNIGAYRDAQGALQETELLGRTAILALGFPLVRNIDTYGYGLFELRQSASEVDVADQKFDSEVDIVSASWIYGKALGSGGAFEYALNLSFGEQREMPQGIENGDETFSYVRFGLGYEHPIGLFGPESTLRAEVWGQHSQDQLPSIEEFYLGGIDAERGYVFAEAQGDSGYSASLELSRDLFPNSEHINRLRPFGFFDYGQVWNNDPRAHEIDDATLSSIGLGIDAEFTNGFFARSYVAAPLQDGPSTKAGDPAFYLNLSKSW